MKVLKFGGTSVGTIDSLLSVKKIVESIEGKAVVVVSALGGLTDRLIATTEMAEKGEPGYRKEIEAMAERHHKIIENVVKPERQGATMAKVDALLEELAQTYDEVAEAGKASSLIADKIVSFGERMSSVIVAAMIEKATHFNSPDFIKTEKWYERNIADSALTDRLIRETLGGDYKTAVAGGFISTDRDTGEITNLGRGGSDYTAALIAASLGASELEIWTDVDGFMTADPRIIPDAKIIGHMTFIESMELCRNGAKVIYPPTIYPVFHKNIPIRILNTFNPEAPGTLITDEILSGDLKVKGVSALRDTTLITVTGAPREGDVNSRTSNAMNTNGVSISLVRRPEEDAGFSFAVRAPESGIALKVLTDEFANEVAHGELEGIEATYKLSTLAIVGEGLQHRPELPAMLCGVLFANGVKVYAASAEPSQTTYTLVVNSRQTDRSLQLIHSLLFSAKYSVNND